MPTSSSHKQAVAVALSVGNEIDRIVARMGTVEHPRGAVVSAYRMARSSLGSDQSFANVRDTLGWLRNHVGQIMRDVLMSARDAATGFAQRLLSIFNVPYVSAPVDPTASYWRAWFAQLEGQLAYTEALMQSPVTADVELVVGDDNRVGLLTPGGIIRDGARLAAFAVNGGIDDVLIMSLLMAGKQGQHKRQAVALIDNRTTDCCLRVNGQVVGQEEDFRLTGYPRYASRMRNPPFHWYCRTTVALIRNEDAGDEHTVEMRESAKAELAAREEKRKTTRPVRQRTEVAA